MPATWLSRHHRPTSARTTSEICAGEPRSARTRNRDLSLSRPDHDDVPGLEVAMNDPHGVRLGQGLRQLDPDGDGGGWGQMPLRSRAASVSSATYSMTLWTPRHDQRCRIRTRIQVIETRGRPRLAHEAAARIGPAEIEDPRRFGRRGGEAGDRQRGRPRPSRPCRASRRSDTGRPIERPWERRLWL